MHLYRYTHQCQEAVQGLCSSDWRQRVSVLKHHCAEAQYVVATWGLHMYGSASEFRNTLSLRGASVEGLHIYHIPSAIPSLTFPIYLIHPKPCPPTYIVHTDSNYTWYDTDHTDMHIHHICPSHTQYTSKHRHYNYTHTHICHTLHATHIPHKSSGQDKRLGHLKMGVKMNCVELKSCWGHV